ncbi:DapH/DapD/GlmU-related protein [Massilia sp. W12]|uniref:DapH/DapD/GlmU-related protein n=1 Tax=Massilia sp. W12 TaxID=3126507 RepID=UPI0030D5C02F
MNNKPFISIHQEARIDTTARIGVESEQRLRGSAMDNSKSSNIIIGRNVLIGGFASIYEGVIVGEDSIIEDQSRIGPFSQIGSGCRVCYQAHISDNVSIGDNCVIASFICDDSVVEDNCRIFGSLVHEQSQPHKGWWDITEAAPKVKKGTVIGWGAIIIGGITIGENSYIAAGAIITKDIPENSIVTGVNKISQKEKWSGKKLTQWIKK